MALDGVMLRHEAPLKQVHVRDPDRWATGSSNMADQHFSRGEIELVRFHNGYSDNFFSGAHDYLMGNGSRHSTVIGSSGRPAADQVSEQREILEAKHGHT
jgi:hypothetical protein